MKRRRWKQKWTAAAFEVEGRKTMNHVHASPFFERKYPFLPVEGFFLQKCCLTFIVSLYRMANGQNETAFRLR